jgi:V/A-type H+-transporting ATPase subunit E
MTEEIKNLISKINEEGIKAAEAKAKEIEDLAAVKAEKIVKKSKAEAEQIISQAKDEIARMRDNTQALLKQAGRDMVLALKGEINAVLERLISSGVRQALNIEELTGILTVLIKNHSGKEKIVITLNAEDAHRLEKVFLDGLREEVRQGIVLRSSQDIQAGFVISYDSGKSSFDFTDKGLAEYIGSSLKPKLKEILQ